MGFVYRGLQAELTRHIVTEEEIDRQITRLQQQNPRIALVEDRPTRLGDEVVLDYAGFCDGTQFAGGTAENQTLVLGSGTFIPGFEEQLVDKVPGEKVTVHVTFPQQYHSAELAGKAAEFRCVIHQIRVKTPYDLDDVFAKEVGGCESFAEMKQKLGESLQAYCDERGEMDLQDRLLRQAAETLEFTITEDQIEKALDEHMQNLRSQLSQQGLSLEMYCQFMNTTEDTLRQDARQDAIMNIRTQTTVNVIAEMEGVQVEEKEIREACELICRQNNMTMEQLNPYYNAELEAAIVHSVLTSKVMGLIRDAANVTVTE